MNKTIKNFERWDITLILIALSFLGPISLDIYLPALPVVANEFGSTIDHVQYTMSLFALGFAVGQLLFGPFSDRFGRVAILKVALWIYIIASLLCLLANSFSVFIFARILQGLGASVGPMLSRAIINDTHEQAEAVKKIGLLVAILLIGPAVGPVLGSYIIAHTEWRAVFYFMIGFSAILLAGTYTRLPESNLHKNKDSTKLHWIYSNLRVFIKNRRYVSSAICCISGFAGYFTVVTAAPFVFMIFFKVQITYFGWLFALIMTGFIVGSYLTRFLIKAVSIPVIVIIGSLISLISVICLLVLTIGNHQNLVYVSIGLWLFYLGCGFGFPSALTNAIKTFPMVAGLVSAVTGFIYWFAGTLSGAILSLVHRNSIMPMILILFSLCIINVCSSLMIPKVER